MADSKAKAKKKGAGFGRSRAKRKPKEEARNMKVNEANSLFSQNSGPEDSVLSEPASAEQSDPRLDGVPEDDRGTVN